MSDMTLFDGGSNLPSYLADFEEGGNLDTSGGGNSLSIKGKVFTINHEGESVMLTRYDEDTGENEPLTSIPIVVLDQAPFGSREYYAKSYDSDSTGGPVCWSVDGKSPHASSPEPQSKSCATCPHAVKGSRITPNGTQTTACQYRRRLAIVPANKPEFSALLLKLAPTSAYDPDTKNSPTGWFAWRQYLDFLNSRGVRHTAQLITRLRFDSNAEYPKLLFKPERFLTEEEAKVIGPRIRGDEVVELLDPPHEGPAVPVVETVYEDEAAPAQEPEPEPEPEPAKAATANDFGFGDEPDPEPVKKKAAKKKAAKKKVTKKKVTKKVVAKPDDVELVREPAKGQQAKEAPQEKSEVHKLLDEWDV